VGSLLAGVDVRALPDASSLADLTACAPGVVLVEEGALDGAGLLALAGAVAEAGAPWRIALLAPGEPPTVRVLSLGYPEPLSGAAEYAHDAGKATTLLELRSVLARISRVRHDVNNFLTPAFTELQILLMDTPEGELRETLEVVESQLRRIRDLMASTGWLRPRP
jgi:signal transduction histidine kinase